MINLAPSAVDALTESATAITSGITKNVPVVGNAAICVDSLCTTGRAGINFYYSPNPISKVFFCASCLCGLMGATASGTALVTTFGGIPVAGWLGSFGARGFNRLGKYTLHMGNITSGNITNTTEIAGIVSPLLILPNPFMWILKASQKTFRDGHPYIKYFIYFYIVNCSSEVYPKLTYNYWSLTLVLTRLFKQSLF